MLQFQLFDHWSLVAHGQRHQNKLFEVIWLGKQTVLVCLVFTATYGVQFSCVKELGVILFDRLLVNVLYMNVAILQIWCLFPPAFGSHDLVIFCTIGLDEHFGVHRLIVRIGRSSIYAIQLLLLLVNVRLKVELCYPLVDLGE